jgi:hypothetical protein
MHSSVRGLDVILLREYSSVWVLSSGRYRPVDQSHQAFAELALLEKVSVDSGVYARARFGPDETLVVS